MRIIDVDRGLNSIKKYFQEHDYALSILIAVLVIAIGLFFGWYNNKVVTVSTNPLAHYSQETTNPLSFMANWDGPNYLAIAKSGYSSKAMTNFFPLYPLLIRIVSTVIRSGVDSALLISWVCFSGAIYYYLKIIKLLYKVKDNFEALRGLAFFVLFPTGIFMLATYTESLFALMALGSIYYALQKKYLPAAIFALFATASHINGIFVLILMALILLEEKVRIDKVIYSFIVGSLGIAAYSLYLLKKFDSPLSFVSSQKSHGWLQHNYAYAISQIGIFNIIFLILLVISIVYWWKRRKSFSIYSFLYICIPLVGRQFGGFNRYVLMAFPIQFMLYEYLRDKKNAYTIATFILSVSWTYFLLQYAGGYVGG